MSTDTRSQIERSAPSKRKNRDGSEEVPPARKKVHRKANKADDQAQSVDFSKGDAAKPKVTPKFKDKFAPKPEKEYPSINDLKKRIRDVKRLLNKVDLPADARILQERALAGYEQDLADETTRRERSSLIKKYHFVRFLGMWPIYLNGPGSQLMYFVLIEQTEKQPPRNSTDLLAARKKKIWIRNKRLVLRQKSITAV